jgi:hypothetical protein
VIYSIVIAQKNAKNASVVGNGAWNISIRGVMEARTDRERLVTAVSVVPAYAV